MTENIEVNTHSSIRIRAGETTIYVDPFKIKEADHDADIIFITHDHYDHFSPEDIGKISSKETILVVPYKMEKKANALLDKVSKVETVRPGVYKNLAGIEFDTVPAYNTFAIFHTKSSEWVGYVLRVDGKRIYIAGDTDVTKEAKQVKCDIAMVPVGGKFTMDAKKAAELVNAIHPSVAIPTHYGSIVGSPGDAETFAKHVNPPIRVEIMLQEL